MNENPSRQVAAVTGATGSIGKAIAIQLAKLNLKVVIIARDPEKSASAVEEIKTKSNNPAVTYKIADLSRKSSILSLAASWEGPLHILVNNAAVAPQSRLLSPEGIELQFATNVLGYFWMTKGFSTTLSDSSPSRIINVASYWAGGLDLNDLEFARRPYHNHDAYRQSKQANRMLTPIFSKLYNNQDISINACHPGDVRSPLSADLGFGGSQTALDGAKTPVWLASSPSLAGISGKYFENQKEVHCQFGAQTKLSEKLYEICETY